MDQMATPTQRFTAQDNQFSHLQQQQQQSQQQQSQQQQQWSAAHLLPPRIQTNSFPSPGASPSPIADPGYSSYFPHHSLTSDAGTQPASSPLTLSISTLSMHSSTPSPIHPSAGSALSPLSASPIQPPSSGLSPQSAQQNIFSSHSSQPFSLNGENWPAFTADQGSSRSTSSSDKSSLFTKGSLATTPLSLNVSMEDGICSAPSNRIPFDEMDMFQGDSNESPVDGGTGSDPSEDPKPMDGLLNSSQSDILGTGGFHPHLANGTGALGGFNVLGKPPSHNNFVSKLYQMINDPKSSQFISWTELGTSFVVTSVGEFSRSILGAHFKHNNFSSFVRQLNMYGFHKINRTPRAQRTSSDAQTWEFSHHKFLRGRPDLLDEIKRKALEPDPSIRQRVELPAEVAMQLGRMHSDHQRVVQALNAEHAKVERLNTVVKSLYELLSRTFPGQLPGPFPAELLDSTDNPPIFITSPPEPSFQQSYPYFGINTISPGSSPTSAEFPFSSGGPNGHHSHGLRLSLDPHAQSSGSSTARYDSALTTPLPPSPSALSSGFNDMMGDGRPTGSKRQRVDDGGSSHHSPASAVSPSAEQPPVIRRLARARSDSAPLGMPLGSTWDGGRPRSGTSLSRGRREEHYNTKGASPTGSYTPRSVTVKSELDPNR